MDMLPRNCRERQAVNLLRTATAQTMVTPEFTADGRFVTVCAHRDALGLPGSMEGINLVSLLE